MKKKRGQSAMRMEMIPEQIQIQSLRQELHMTQAMVQSLRVLSLSLPQLREEIWRELDQNPCLEEVAPETNSADEHLEVIINTSEADWQDPRYYDDEGDGGGAGEGAHPTDSWVTHKPTLQEHLMSQIPLCAFQKYQKLIAEWIIWNLDENGYLRASVEEIARETQYTEHAVERVRKEIQLLHPVGTASLHLADCLLAQLSVIRPRTDVTILAQRILTRHIDLLAKRRYRKLAKITGATLEKVIAARRVILSLDPKPGLEYLGRPTHYVVPDAYVRREGEKWVVTINGTGLPKIRASQYYTKMMKYLAAAAVVRSNGGKCEREREFIKIQLTRAHRLIKDVERRESTLTKVIQLILRDQEAFFWNGPSHMRPLLAKTAAHELGVASSTVSRAINNKYIQTPHGVFELKEFFNVRNRGTSQLAVPSTTMALIKRMVEDENPLHPLTDRDIQRELKDVGVYISERMVTKYRARLGIPASLMRKAA